MMTWINARITRRLTMVVGGVCMGLVIAASIVTWWHVKRLSIEDAYTRIETVAILLARQADPQRLQSLTTAYPNMDGIRAGSEPAEYIALRAPLLAAQSDVGLGTPVYLMTQRSDTSAIVAQSPKQPHADAMEFLLTSADAPYWRHRYVWKPEMAAAWYEGHVVRLPPYRDDHGTWISVYAPVHGPAGSTIALMVADRRLDQLLADVRNNVLGALLPLMIITGLGIIVTVMVAHRLAKPIVNLAGQAARLARGDYHTLITSSSSDEIGSLARTLDRARSDVQGVVGRILGNMPALLCTIQRDGHVGPHVSAQLVALAHQPLPGAPVSALPFAEDGQLASALDLLFMEGSPLPPEDALGMAPRTWSNSGRSFALSYTPIMQGARIDGVLVIGRDISEERRLASAKETQERHQRMVLTLIGNRRLFSAFQAETEAGLARGRSLLASGDPGQAGIQELFRIVHTIKGSGLSLDLHDLGQYAATIEDRLSLARSTGVLADPATLVADLDAMAHLLGAAVAEIVTITSDDGRTLAIEPWEIEALGRAMREGRLDDGARILADLRHPSLRSYLEPKVASLVEDTVERTGKPVDPDIACIDARVPASLIGTIEACMPHLVRNAIDHGLEDEDERRAAGKDPSGHLHIVVRREPGGFVVEVRDDGRGIDPDRIAAAAVRKGVISANEAESLDANMRMSMILRPGFSTAETVTDVSGRGVGLDAVAVKVAARGGELAISSRVGFGTTFRLWLPDAVSE